MGALAVWVADGEGTRRERGSNFCSFPRTTQARACRTAGSLELWLVAQAAVTRELHASRLPQAEHVPDMAGGAREE